MVNRFSFQCFVIAEFPFQLILYFLFYVSLDVQYFCYLSFRCVYRFPSLISIELRKRAFWGKRRMSLVGRAKNSCRCCSSNVELTYSSRLQSLFHIPSYDSLIGTAVVQRICSFSSLSFFFGLRWWNLSSTPRITVWSLSLVFRSFCSWCNGFGTKWN